MIPRVCLTKNAGDRRATTGDGVNASENPVDGGRAGRASGAVGSLLAGRYRVLDLIGRGGMASVYRAEDETLGRTVAVKLFDADGSESGDLRRQTSEIRLLASLNHHALVTLFDASVDEANGTPQAFLVMELVEGTTLQERLVSGLPAQVDVALMVADIAEGLHTVHQRGVVHRDIKPANVLLSASLTAGREFRAKLADFGIAYLVDSTRLTTPGTLIGTAAYVSPEQALGKTPGPASDIYSLGLVLLEALTGARAFPGTVIESLTARIVNPPAIPDSVGPVWGDLIARMTALDPGDRPEALDIAHRARALEVELTGPTPPWFAAQPAAAAVASAATADQATEAMAAADVMADTELLAKTELMAGPEVAAGTEVLGESDALPATERLTSADEFAPTAVMPGAAERDLEPAAVMSAPTAVMPSRTSRTEVLGSAGVAASASGAPSVPAARRGPGRRALVIIGIAVVAVLVVVGVIWGSAASRTSTPRPAPAASATPTPVPSPTATTTPAAVVPTSEPTVVAPSAPANPGNGGGNGKGQGKPDKAPKPGKDKKNP